MLRQLAWMYLDQGARPVGNCTKEGSIIVHQCATSPRQVGQIPRAELLNAAPGSCAVCSHQALVMMACNPSTRNQEQCR